MVIFLVGVHSGKQQIKKSGRGGILGFNFLLEKQEGCRGLNIFFIRIGVTTEFCWDDKMTPNPDAPRSGQ